MRFVIDLSYPFTETVLRFITVFFERRVKNLLSSALSAIIARMKEIEILKWVHDTFHSQAWLNYIMVAITYIGEFGLSVMACALILFLVKKTRRAGFDMAMGILFNLLIVNVILKYSVNRARPWTEYAEFTQFYEQFGVRQPSDSSFPSGHASILFCGAVSLLFSYKIKALPALAVAFLVALSRIYLCLHYPTDVLGGILVGTACGVAGHYASRGILALIAKKTKKEGGAETLSSEPPPLAERDEENKE